MKGIDPFLPLSVYTRKQENCQDFATDVRVPISEETMAPNMPSNAGTSLAHGKNELAAQKLTRPNWKTHWTRAFQENRDIQSLMGSQLNHQEISKKMVTCLDNLANAAIQKNDTIKILVNTNKQLTKTIHNLQEQNTKILLPLEKYASAAATKAVRKANTTTESTGVWDPNGYYWTHGFKVKKGHTSTTCKLKGRGTKREPHAATQWEAVNTM
ncbi:hypothetical protein ACHAW6_006600 [Cyclotella cf. meneghiniana]